MGAAVLAAALVLPIAQVPAHAQSADDSLPFSGGYLVTGNYIDGAVDLTEQANPPDADGFATGTIHINNVPTDAEIVAAYLFFQVITPTAELSQARVKFRGQEISLTNGSGVKTNRQDLLGSLATCWSSGTPLTMSHFRVDVLRLLPVRLDKNGKPTPKHVVNDADLTAHGLSLHTVSLLTRNGNQIPESAGASLVLVYRNPDPSEPLRKIVFYDGIYVQPSLTTPMTKTLRGFYLSSSTKSAKITHIIASGQPNNNERVFFDDGPFAGSKQVSAPDPIAGGSSSQRGWTDLTYDVSTRMNPGNNSGDGYGETATTTVDHSGGGGYDCLSWDAVIFSTAVKDTDPSNDPGAPPGDGLPDGLEDAVSGLLDADSQPLPNLNAMHASSSQRDLFIEVNAMWAAPGTQWGSPSAPYDSTHVSKTDLNGHHHRPTPADLKMMIDRYTAHGITPRFDVGDIDAYHALGVITHTDWVDDYTSTEADTYLVPSYLARGGELIKERACDPASAACRFPDYPGVVGWKFGFQLLRDFPVRDDGSELTPEQLTDPGSSGYFDWNSGEHRRRFDLKRRGLFHYVLYAHLLWKRKSPLPCLVGGLPAPYDAENGTACTTDNPDFHVPSGTSGIAELPGNNAMVTLGRFDEFIGRPYVRAATAFHELGHNMNLWHGGLPTVWGNKALNTATYVEPNCKSFPSSMSYLYQMHGMYDNDDNIHIDYTGTKQNDLTEATAPIDQSLSPVTIYRPAWYAPAGSALATSLGASATTRYCSGQKFDPTSPPSPAMARVYATLNNDPIDWNGNGTIDAALPNQDVNFDAKLSTTLYGFNDWANLRLQQLGAGRNKDLFHSAAGSVVSLSGDDLDAIGDDVDAIGDDIDAIGDDLDAIGDDLDAIGDDVDAIGDDLDAIGDDLDAIGDQEIDVATANALGKSVPYAVRARIISDAVTCAATFNPQCHARAFSWQSPSFGHVFLYQGSRKRGNANSSYPYVDIGTSSTTSFIEDTQPVPSPGAQLPDGVSFTYRFRAEFDDQTPHELSGFSKSVTITAVNNAPVANPDPNYTTTRNTALRVNTQALGVLGNDNDVDSPASFLRAVLVSGPANGTLIFNADGTFTYTPKNGFVGTDTFRYKANNGMWADDPTVPLSPDSSPATGTVVTITVNAR